MRSIDINMDCGEHPDYKSDALLMPYVSSLNIACGGHAGNRQSMQYLVSMAAAAGLRIGAHPSIPDPEGFGRTWYDTDSAVLAEDLYTQMNELASICEAKNTRLHHVKLHGALYHRATHHSEVAKAVISSIEQLAAPVVIFAPERSELTQLALSRGFTVWAEVFADRNYRGDGTLVPRNAPNALITVFEEVLQRFEEVFLKGLIRTVDGTLIEARADTICFHSDHAYTSYLIARLYRELPKLGLSLQR